MSWFPFESDSAFPEVRLFCFAHAGAGASVYREWDELLGDEIEVCPVQLPGHETRMREKPVTNMRTLTRRLVEALGELCLETPFALFGHSLGGYVAYELARELESELGVTPRRLFISGAPVPGTPSRRKPAAEMSDDDLIAYLRDMKGTDDRVLENAWLRHMYLPVLRADLQLLDSYEHPKGRGPMSCPITVLGGERDPLVEPAELAAWAHRAARDFRMKLVPGGHFFIRDAQSRVLRTVSEHLASPPAAAPYAGEEARRV